LSNHPATTVDIGRVGVRIDNPLFKDMGCGIEERWLVKYKLKHGRSRRINDTDTDGLLDIDEFMRGTDPRNPDTDGDGAPDGYEVRYGMDPLKPLTAAELASDADHDGVSLASEIARWTPPIVRPPGSEWAD